MSKQYTVQIEANKDVLLSSQEQLSVQIQQFHREHYELSCWKDYNENFYDKDGTINIDYDTVISAVWIGQKYNVMLNKNGGTCTDLSSYRYLQGAVLPTDWTKVGCSFVGWKNNQDLTGNNINEISLDTYGDVEFWAKYQQQMGNIDFTTTLGNTYTFSNSDIPSPLQYVAPGINYIIVQQPYSLCAELSNKDYLYGVYDRNGCVYEIGSSAFYNCSNLEYAKLSNLTEISPYSFYDSGIRNVYFPKAKVIGESSFQKANGLYSFNGQYVLSVMDSAFAQKIYGIGAERQYLTSVYLPKCEYIGNNSFYSCSSLQHVYLDNILSIYDSAFSQCIELNEIEGISNAVYIGDFCFDFDKNISSICLPKIKTISQNSFYRCSNLMDVYIPNVTYIDYCGFTDCGNLISIDINNCSSIGMHSFEGCESLKTIKCDSLIHMGQYSFYGCSKIKDIYLPNLLSIEDCAFEECTNLESIYCPKLSCFCNEGVGFGQFNNCSNLKTIILSSIDNPPELQVNSHMYMFNGCDNIVSVYVKNNQVVELFQEAYEWEYLIDYDKITIKAVDDK